MVAGEPFQVLTRSHDLVFDLLLQPATTTTIYHSFPAFHRRSFPTPYTNRKTNSLSTLDLILPALPFVSLCKLVLVFAHAAMDSPCAQSSSVTACLRGRMRPFPSYPSSLLLSVLSSSLSDDSKDQTPRRHMLKSKHMLHIYDSPQPLKSK